MSCFLIFDTQSFSYEMGKLKKQLKKQAYTYIIKALDKRSDDG